MANNYMQFCVYVPFEHEQEVAWVHAHRILSPEEMEDANVDKLSEHFGIPKEDLLDGPWPPADMSVEADGFYMASEEGANLDAVGLFLSAFLEDNERSDIIGIEWAEFCSKLRPGEFGGGAMAISAKDVIFESTSTTLVKLRKLLKEK